MFAPAAAEKLILDSIPLYHREDCPLADAPARALREELRADRDMPPFERVTMDGYAVRSADLAAGTRRFQSVGIQAAGMIPLKLGGPGTCVEIMTGAVLAAGADAVVPYEETVPGEGGMTVTEAGGLLTAGHAVHARASNHRRGDVIVPAGVRLSGREIAVAAACGYATVTVSQLPKIAVIATGDELVDIGSLVAPHQIRRSNDYALRAGLAAAGYPRAECFHLHDVRHEIEHQLWHILAEFDAVVITGGVSKGKFDLLPAELERQGVRKIFHGVAQRPGKPFWYGLSARRTPVFALPGNPVSAYTCLHRYVFPALDHASGLTPAPLRWVALGRAFRFRPPLACLLPVRLQSGPDAQVVAMPAEVGTSGDFAGLVGTDGFVELPAGPEDFPAGMVVAYRRWL